MNERDVEAFFGTEDKARIEGVRTSIANRLRKACSHLSDEEFAALVEKMTKVQLGGERRPR
jgi:hypothetical protein